MAVSHQSFPAPFCRRDGYLPGVQALLRSVRLVGGRYPFIVLYTAGVGADAVRALAQEGCLMQFTEQFHPQGALRCAVLVVRRVPPHGPCIAPIPCPSPGMPLV